MIGIVSNCTGAPGEGIECGAVIHLKLWDLQPCPHATMFALLDDADVIGRDRIGRGRIHLQLCERVLDLRLKFGCSADYDAVVSRAQSWCHTTAGDLQYSGE